MKVPWTEPTQPMTRWDEVTLRAAWPESPKYRERQLYGLLFVGLGAFVLGSNLMSDAWDRAPLGLLVCCAVGCGTMLWFAALVHDARSQLAKRPDLEITLRRHHLDWNGRIVPIRAIRRVGPGSGDNLLEVELWGGERLVIGEGYVVDDGSRIEVLVEGVQLRREAEDAATEVSGDRERLQRLTAR